MERMIRVMLPVAEQQGVVKVLNECRDKLKGISVGLSDTEKTGVRSMAEGREGLARLVNKIALAHINSLAREDDPNELDSRLQYDSQLEDLRQQIMALHEAVEETQLANSRDIMTLVDKFAGSLQNSRKGNASLDMAMREVDDYNKRFANKPKDPEAPAEPGK
jgi:hypothetical protein